MTDTLITHLQVFGIGFSFGVAGPCFLVCTPILITYIVGRQGKWMATVVDISLFLFGRLCAYIILGALAGLSGYYLRRLSGSDIVSYFNITSGVISILLGMFILLRKDTPVCAHKRSNNNIYEFGSVLALGFLIGISPCVPLTALLLEIALISNNALEGAAYAFSFGLGTFLSGIIVVGAIAGILKGSLQKMIHSSTANLIFKVLCSALLFIFGTRLIIGGFKF